MLAGKILLLLFVANGAPIILGKFLDQRFAWPVDGGLVLPDGRPLFGSSKTWRGVAGAVAASGGAAWVLGFDPEVGIRVGLLAMFGDLFSSFLKRRFDVPVSGMALGLDQIPESLFPLLGLKEEWGLDEGEVMGLTAMFLLLELAVSRVLYRLRIRSQPY